MNSGTASGERIAQLFDEAGLLNAAEVKVVHDDPPIFGFMDLAITWQGKQMIGEVKTTKTELFQTRAATMKPPGYQLIQLLIYMYLYEKDDGFFVIEDKNDHRLLIIPVKMTKKNKEYVEYVLDWMREVRAAYEADELPNRPFNKSSSECKYCPLKDDCWEGWERKTAKKAGNDPMPGTIDIEPLQIQQ